MDAPVAQSWFLRKNEDGHIFGPLSFEQLARWASSAQVAPQDVLSSDQVTWIKAPMLQELGMDWLVELTSERYYGPTTLGAVQEFMRLGEINEQTFLINSCERRAPPDRRDVVDSPDAARARRCCGAGGGSSFRRTRGNRHVHRRARSNPRSRTKFTRRTPRAPRSRRAISRLGIEIPGAGATALDSLGRDVESLFWSWKLDVGR